MGDQGHGAKPESARDAARSAEHRSEQREATAQRHPGERLNHYAHQDAQPAEVPAPRSPPLAWRDAAQLSGFLGGCSLGVWLSVRYVMRPSAHADESGAVLGSLLSLVTGTMGAMLGDALYGAICELQQRKKNSRNKH